MKTATLLSNEIVGGSIAKISFKSNSTFRYEPGQFISIQIPTLHGHPVKRLYSLASPYELTGQNGYELCIKKVENGLGSTFLMNLNPGDQFRFQAPFGHFHFQGGRKRPVVFIGTGSGIAPLRSIALSQEFNHDDIPFALALFGFRSSAEIPYQGEFEDLGIATRYAVSSEIPSSRLFRKERVTSILRKMKSNFPWVECDYYICGNPEMIAESREILFSKKVDDSSIFYESFAAAINEQKIAG